MDIYYRSMNFMKTFTQTSHSEEELDMISSEMCLSEVSSITLPLQEMFDEFMVLISKADFE